MFSRGVAKSTVYSIVMSLALLCVVQTDLAANEFQTTLYGTIYLEADPVPGAVIIAKDQDTKKESGRVSSDELGYYQLDIAKGTHQLEIELPKSYHV